MNEIQYFESQKDGVVVAKLSDVNFSAEQRRDKIIQGRIWIPFRYKELTMVPATISGKAKCSPMDTFDAETGGKIARLRLLKKKEKANARYMKYYAKLFQELANDFANEVMRNEANVAKYEAELKELN